MSADANNHMSLVQCHAEFLPARGGCSRFLGSASPGFAQQTKLLNFGTAKLMFDLGTPAQELCASNQYDWLYFYN